MNFPSWRKWMITPIATMSVFAVTLTSSAYSASAKEGTVQFHASSELFKAGVALFVLGFAVGPALWAPLSELYGRQTLSWLRDFPFVCNNTFLSNSFFFTASPRT